MRIALGELLDARSSPSLRFSDQPCRLEPISFHRACGSGRHAMPGRRSVFDLCSPARRHRPPNLRNPVRNRISATCGCRDDGNKGQLCLSDGWGRLPEISRSKSATKVIDAGHPGHSFLRTPAARASKAAPGSFLLFVFRRWVPRGRHAIVSIIHSCEALCGGGKSHFFEQKNGK